MLSSKLIYCRLVSIFCDIYCKQSVKQNSMLCNPTLSDLLREYSSTVNQSEEGVSVWGNSPSSPSKTDTSKTYCPTAPSFPSEVVYIIISPFFGVSSSYTQSSLVAYLNINRS